MCKFFRRGFSAAVLLVMVLSMLVLPQGSVEAGKAPVHELNYFKSYETEVEGQKAYRIEIVMDREGLEYQVVAKTFVRKQLVLDFLDRYLKK